MNKSGYLFRRNSWKSGITLTLLNSQDPDIFLQTINNTTMKVNYRPIRAVIFGFSNFYTVLKCESGSAFLL